MTIDFVSLIIGAIFGAVPTWIFTHIYYRKASVDNNKQTEILKIHQELLMDELENEIVEEVIDEIKEEIQK